MIECGYEPQDCYCQPKGSIVSVDRVARKQYGVSFDEEAYQDLLEDYGLPGSPEHLAVNIVFASPGYGTPNVFFRGSIGSERSKDGKTEKHHIFVNLYDCIDYAEYYEADLEGVLNWTLLHETGHYSDYLTPFGDLRCVATQARGGIENGFRATGRADTAQVMNDNLLPLVGVYPVLSSVVLGVAQAANVASHRVAQSFSGGRLYKNSLGEIAANSFANQNADRRIITVAG